MLERPGSSQPSNQTPTTERPPTRPEAGHPEAVRGEAGVMLGTTARDASNARAKRELGLDAALSELAAGLRCRDAGRIDLQLNLSAGEGRSHPVAI